MRAATTPIQRRKSSRNSRMKGRGNEEPKWSRVTKRVTLSKMSLRINKKKKKLHQMINSQTSPMTKVKNNVPLDRKAR